MLFDLGLESQPSHLLNLQVGLFKSNKHSQVDAELVHILHLQILQLLVDHLLCLVVRAETLFD